MSNPDRPRPERMFRRGRPENQTFSPEEDLYFRFPPSLDEEETYEHLDLSVIRFPDQSVNRSEYSEPEDVIFGLPQFGIGAFLVKDVPDAVESEGGPVYAFKPVHKPDDDNYAHSEVRCYKAGEHMRKAPPNVKKTYRTRLLEKTRIHTRPDPTRS